MAAGRLIAFRNDRLGALGDGPAGAPLFDAPVPGAHVLADVAAVQPLADLGLKLRRNLGGALFDREV